MKYQAYEVYRKCSFPLIESIPEHWVEQKIKFQLEDCIAGGTPDSGNKDYWEESGEGVPWVSIADMTSNEIIEQTQKDISKAGIDVKNLKLVPQGSLLYSIFASLGKVAEAGVDLTTNQAILALIPSDSVCNKYFRYWLISIEDYLMYFSTSNTQNNLNAEKVRNLPLFLPRREVQANIANFLDHETAKIDTLIKKQQQLIKLLKEKRQAVISHAVTKGLNPNAPMRDSGVEWLGEVPEHWVVSQIGHCAFVTKLTGFEYTNLWKIEEGGEIVALRGFNVKERALDLDNVERISSELSNVLKRSKLASGDIVFPCTGTIGNAAMIERDNEFHINQNIAKIRFDETVYAKYATYWMTSLFVRTLIDRNNTSGMQPVVLIGDIRKLPMPRFKFQEQKEITDFLDSTVGKFNVLITNSENAIELMQERRTALISAAVTGKIDLRNWQVANKENKETAL